MANICKNCGAQLPENGGFCAACGTPAENNAQPAYAAQPQFPQQSYAVPQPVAEEKKPNKNIIIIGAVALVAIIAIVAVIAGVAGAGYKKPLKALAESYEVQDSDMYIEAYADDVLDLDADGKDAIDWYFDIIYDYLEDECGEGYKVSVTYNDKEKLDKDSIEDFVDELEEEDGVELDADDIAKLYVVDFTITAEGDEEVVILDGEVHVGKYDGEWLILDMDADMECEEEVDRFLEEHAEDYMGEIFDY